MSFTKLLLEEISKEYAMFPFTVKMFPSLFNKQTSIMLIKKGSNVSAPPWLLYQFVCGVVITVASEHNTPQHQQWQRYPSVMNSTLITHMNLSPSPFQMFTHIFLVTSLNY